MVSVNEDAVVDEALDKVAETGTGDEEEYAPCMGGQTRPCSECGKCPF